MSNKVKHSSAVQFAMALIMLSEAKGQKVRIKFPMKRAFGEVVRYKVSHLLDVGCYDIEIVDGVVRFVAKGTERQRGYEMDEQLFVELIEQAVDGNVPFDIEYV